MTAETQKVIDRIRERLLASRERADNQCVNANGTTIDGFATKYTAHGRGEALLETLLFLDEIEAELSQS